MIPDHKITKFNYYRYTLLSNVTFGKRRRRYEEKLKTLRLLLANRDPITLLSAKLSEIDIKFSQVQDFITWLKPVIKSYRVEHELILKLFRGDPARPKVCILNDTSEYKSHAGCVMVMEVIKHLLSVNGIELIWAFPHSSMNNLDESLFYRVMATCDMLILNGEGTMHNNQGKAYLEKCKIAKKMGKKVVLINTVWQDNSQVEYFEYLKYFDLISVRESKSMLEIRAKVDSTRTLVTPDLVFYWAGQGQDKTRQDKTRQDKTRQDKTRLSLSTVL